jgi:beta-galactosidase beta subunit
VDIEITLPNDNDIHNPIQLVAKNCSVYEEPQTFMEPGSLNIEYELYYLDDETKEVDEELVEKHRQYIDDTVYKAWRESFYDY